MKHKQKEKIKDNEEKKENSKEENQIDFLSPFLLSPYIIEQQRHATTLLNQTSLPYCVLNPLGDIIMSNESFSELIGYDKDELKKVNFIEKITHPEYQLDLVEILKTCSSDIILQSLNIPLIRKKDTVIPTSIVRHCLCDLKSNILFSYLFVNKIQFEKEILKETYKEKLEFPRAFLETDDLIFILETSKRELPGLFVEVNDVACQKLGFTKEEFLSMSLFDIVDEESEKVLLEKNNEILQKKQVLYSLKCVGKDRKEINLNFNSLLISSEEGIVELAIAKEVGEESIFKEEIIEEKGIKDDNQLYLDVFMNSNSPMLIVNKDFTIHEANLAFLETFGYSSYEIVSKKFTDFIKKNYLGEELPTEKLFSFSKSSRKNTFNAVFIERADEHKYVELKIGYIDKVKKCIITLTDITQQSILQNALTKSEMKYRELFQNARDLIFLFSFLPNGTSENIIEVNKVACETLGYTREELLEKSINEVVDPDDFKVLRKDIQELQESGKARGEGCLVSKNKEKIPIEFNSTLFQLEENKVILAIARDIRERKKAEESLEREVDINAAVSILSAQLLAPTSIEEISNLVLKYAQMLTTSEFGYVGYIDQNTGYLNATTLTQEIWDVCEVPDKRAVFNKFTGIWGWVLKNKKSLLTNSPIQHPEFIGTPEGHIPIEKFLSVPSLIEDKLVGQISLANPKRDYNKKDLEIIERLAAIYAISLDRERDKEQIDLQNKYLNSVIESLSYPFLVINADDFTVQLANKEACKGEIKENTKCYQLTHKRDSKCSSLTEICPLEIIKETKQPMSVDHIHYDENLNPIFVEIHCSPIINKNGKVTQMIESIVDVTEKKKTERTIKESEEKYRLLFDKASDALFLVNITDDGEIGKFIDVNAEACKRLGYSKRELLEMTLQEITKPEQYHRIPILMKELLEKKEKTFEIISIAKNGKEIPVEINAHVIKLQDQLVILSISRDVSFRM
ncbi:MAG: PAS domain S-box protein [Candidatus Heimdallarchaeota archaeon]|nr:PAS domain S-box protein [Candidatus Heimdallarchaeota archaeon]MCK4770721.1 PAS domain S-box protein [Candidatus Heimdallarchaeota archaeon]